MTTKVTVAACCAPDREIHVEVNDVSGTGCALIDDFILQNNETQEFTILDDFMVSICDRKKANLK